MLFGETNLYNLADKFCDAAEQIKGNINSGLLLLECFPLLLSERQVKSQ